LIIVKLPSTPQNLVLFEITVSEIDWIRVPLVEFNLHSYFPVWFEISFTIDKLLKKKVDQNWKYLHKL